MAGIRDSTRQIQVKRSRSKPEPPLFSALQLRPQIIPARAVTENNTSDELDGAPHHARSARMSWARLLKRVFDIDVEHCPHCGGNLKIIAAIEDPSVITKILDHLGLATRAPPRAPARSFDLLETA